MHRNTQNLMILKESQSMINERNSLYVKSLHKKAVSNQNIKTNEKILKCNRQSMNHQRSVRKIRYNKLLQNKGYELMQQYQFQVEDALIAKKIHRSKSFIT
jgi:hypothetical protein